MFFSFVRVDYMLGDDHSLMGESDDAWSGAIVGLFGRPLSFCTILSQDSCVRAP